MVIQEMIQVSVLDMAELKTRVSKLSAGGGTRLLAVSAWVWRMRGVCVGVCVRACTRGVHAGCAYGREGAQNGETCAYIIYARVYVSILLRCYSQLF